MSVLLPDQRLWATNRWIARQFFADVIQWIDTAPALAGEIRFCLEAELDTLDLRHADRATLQAFAALVKKVIDDRTAADTSDIAGQSYVHVYMSKLVDLHQLVQAILDKHS